MKARALALLAAAALGAPAPAAAESSLACPGGIVQPGDAKIDLIAKCGEPAVRDALLEERALGAGELPAAGVRATLAVEQWTYNFGPSRFIHVVTLEGGKVVAIERGGYGYDPERLRPAEKSPVARCDASALQVGDSKLDLLAKCGEPWSKDARLEARAVAAGEGATAAATVTVRVEVWTYNFGPRRFIHFATLENGKVVRVERGGYGYER